MLANGSTIPSASTIDSAKLAPFSSNPPPTNADVTKIFMISQTDIVNWVVNEYPYTEPTTPILYSNFSASSLANTTIPLPFNSTIDIIMKIANDSMDAVAASLSFLSACLGGEELS